MTEPRSLAAQLVKACCADFYEHDLVRDLLGDTLHPGGLELTRRLAQALGLQPGQRVLDLACGPGASALLLAREFGCRVTGVDYGLQNVQAARASASEAGLAGQVESLVGDVETLPSPDGAYDVIVCECALSTFPDKEAALAEAHRVLRVGGHLGLADVILDGSLPEELQGVAASVACVGQALSARGYVEAIRNANFRSITVEDHTPVVAELVRDLQRKVLLLRMAGAGVSLLPGVDLGQVQRLLGLASKAVEQGTLGYALFVAKR